MAGLSQQLGERFAAAYDAREQKKAKRTYTPRQARVRSIILTVVFAVCFYYLYLPALNPKDIALYLYCGGVLALYFILRLVYSGIYTSSIKAKELGGFWWKNCRIAVIAFLLLLAMGLVGGAVSNEFVAARTYHDLLDVENGDFTSDVYTISLDQIPTLDASSASTLGDRALGELSDIVSQYEAESLYTQINYQGRPVRVASLKYGDIVKWFVNRGSGLPGYIMVDMVSQQATIVRLSEGIRYSPSERFGRDLVRHLRFQYPTYLFDTPHLEIDEDGVPYWICPRLDKTIGFLGGTDVEGAVIMNAVTGESTYYALTDIPEWVDQVYSTELILKQYSYYGKYGSGFINSLLGQSGVTKTTEGSNYLALNDDVYLYTGITSANNDNSTIGFILCNQRTKETRYYAVTGAKEQSAMTSAAGAVQDQSYSATFPLLLNISEQPTYFIALKDNADLVKQYAMVNVSQYQLVATGASLKECEQNYNALLAQNGIETSSSPETVDAPELKQVNGMIESISSCVVDGTSIYYLRLTEDTVYYEISAADFPHAAIAKPGDSVQLTVPTDSTGSIRPVSSVHFPWDDG